MYVYVAMAPNRMMMMRVWKLFGAYYPLTYSIRLLKTLLSCYDNPNDYRVEYKYLSTVEPEYHLMIYMFRKGKSTTKSCR